MEGRGSDSSWARLDELVNPKEGFWLAAVMIDSSIIYLD